MAWHRIGDNEPILLARFIDAYAAIAGDELIYFEVLLYFNKAQGIKLEALFHYRLYLTDNVFKLIFIIEISINFVLIKNKSVLIRVIFWWHIAS